jgi:hypothetical protein
MRLHLAVNLWKAPQDVLTEGTKHRLKWSFTLNVLDVSGLYLGQVRTLHCGKWKNNLHSLWKPSSEMRNTGIFSFPSHMCKLSQPVRFIPAFFLFFLDNPKQRFFSNVLLFIFHSEIYKPPICCSRAVLDSAIYPEKTWQGNIRVCPAHPSDPWPSCVLLLPPGRWGQRSGLLKGWCGWVYGWWVVVGEGASLRCSSARNMLQPLHLCYSTRQRPGQLVFLLRAVAHVAAIGVDVPEKNRDSMCNVRC